jgi:hypothetical protein
LPNALHRNEVIIEGGIAMKKQISITCSVAFLFLVLLTGMSIAQTVQDAVHIIPEFTFGNGAKMQNMKVG